MQETEATMMTSGARKERMGCRVSELVNLVVDSRVLFNVGVACRDVGLWLVVVVV